MGALAIIELQRRHLSPYPMSDTDKYQEDSMKQKERKVEKNKKLNSRRKAGRMRKKKSNRRKQTFSHNPEDWD